MTSYEIIQNLLKTGSKEHDITWLFSGDSITHGCVHLNNFRDYVQLFEERIRCELNRDYDVVIRSAIRGWTTENILADIERRILRYKPQVLSIMLGMNDSSWLSVEKFRNNYNSIIDQAKKSSNPALILHTTNPIWPEEQNKRHYLVECNTIIREIAQQQKAVLVDHNKAWLQAIKENSRRLQFWMSDAVHPNAYGHIAFVEELFKKINIFDLTAKTCQLFKP